MNDGAAYCGQNGRRYQPQRDANDCSPTHNQTREEDLGTCGCEAASWESTGAAYCGQNGRRYQPQRDANDCSPTHNQTREEDLGFTCDCKAIPVTPLVRVAPNSFSALTSYTICEDSYVAFGMDRNPAGYTLQWTGPTNAQGPANDNWEINSLLSSQQGIYTYTVTDQNTGCSNSAQVTIAVNPANYLGTIDETSCKLISGWLVDMNCQDRSNQVRILIDDQLVATVMADGVRDDVRRDILGRTTGYNQYGYRWTVPEYLRQGVHSVVVTDIKGNPLNNAQGRSYGVAPPITYVAANDSSYAYRSSVSVCAGSFVALGRDRFPPDYSMRWQGPNGQQGPANQDWYLYHISPTQAGSYTYTYTVTDAYGCTNASTVNMTVNPANYAKSLDELNCTRAAGWIVNTNCSDKATQLLVYINNTLVDSLVTDVARPDARQAVLGNTNGFNLYGFQWTIPENWRIGAYSMTVKDNQGNILFGPATYSIPASPTVHVTDSGLTSLSICPNSSFSLTAEGCPTPINWYTKDAAGGLTYLTTVTPGSPASFSTATTTSYVARCHGYSAGCPDSDDSQTITVYIQSNIPTDPTFNGSSTPSICQGTSVTFASSCPSGQVKWVRYDTPGGSQIGYAIQDELPLGGENPAGEYYMSVECVGTSCAGPARTFTFTVIPKPVFGFAAAGSSPASYSANTTGPVTNQVTICSGGMLTFSGLTLSQSNIGLIEKSFSSGNVTLGGVLLPADRPQNRISSGQMAQGFNQNYGPYATTDANAGTIEQWYTPYVDANDNGQYDEGECLGDRITLQYRILPLAKPTSVSASPASISSPRSVTLNASGCANNTRWEWPTGTYTGATLVTTVNQTTTFGVRCVTEAGCQSDTVAITVKLLNLATPIISASKLAVCGSDTVKLRATGCDNGATVLWSNGMTGSPIVFTPTDTATYYAVCQIDGAQSEHSNTLLINVRPVPTITGARSYTTGQTVSLTATAAEASSYTWQGPNGYTSTGAELRMLGANTSGSYTVTANYTGGGCAPYADVIVTVNGPALQTGEVNQASACQVPY
ncbi:hypothetical protein [Spirosoma endbachense]|uniref:Ig-like domain-containing protein n=1 Tax=Spirosoma endbachense TaxID=2666025 RepID=A0A6P1W081_9BACT|nr:hypothetical protein [Spirosoma endbachense]QHV98793.1 hypothetical protein GJR95_28990 [Spirosoma endbachense]